MTHSRPLISRTTGPLQGDLTPPGDKSISHRAVMLGGLAEGVSHVRGLLEGQDVLATITALRALGAQIGKEGDLWVFRGCGAKGLCETDHVLDMGNSGTSARLLIGLLGARPMMSVFTGDASLSRRPMGRVMVPLSQMGARFMARGGDRLPLCVQGPPEAKAITYRLPVASAQVKSAVLLAGLAADGVTTVIETVPTRDHSERMLAACGAKLHIEKLADGAEAISLTGRPLLKGQDIDVPGDISSAAFPMVAAAIRPGSAVVLRHVGINPRRAGLVQSLLEMGADIEVLSQGEMCGEPVADLLVRGSDQRGITVPALRAPSMIDEYPILAVAAACAQGTTRLLGLAELRVKESDRLSLMARGLAAAGVKVELEDDDLIIHGTGHPPQGGASIETALDHRIAMSFLVLGMATAEPVRIDDGRVMATSFPGFADVMNGIGARIDLG